MSEVLDFFGNVCAMVAAFATVYAGTQIRLMKVHLNSRLDQLLLSEKRVSFDEGGKAERDKP